MFFKTNQKITQISKKKYNFKGSDRLCKIVELSMHGVVVIFFWSFERRIYAKNQDLICLK